MESYYYFLVDGFPKPFGYIHSSTVPNVAWGEHWTIDQDQRLAIFHGGDTFDERCRCMEATSRANPKRDDASAFGRWRHELFPVYDADGEHVLNLDGVGVNTFSIINYAYHIIAYSATDERLRY
jgi:hypothetical protein